MEERKNEFALLLGEIFTTFVLIIGVMLLFGEPKKQTPDPTPTNAPTMTEIPTPTSTPTSTSTPTPSPSPTPTVTPTPIPSERKDVGANHTFKPYTRFHVYDIRGTAQYKLQCVAYTDERTGIRVVDDPLGEPRYCVALGTYWCGGHPQHIGRCVDVHMKNGAVLKCVLADVKRTEDTINAGNRYGAINYDVLEFIVDGGALPDAVKYYCNVSKAGEEFEGDAAYMIVYDMWIEGFGENWNK